MADQVFPTKGNLINLKKSLTLAKSGYDLLDRKRNILVREMMDLISSATEIQEKIDKTFATAYRALQNANITMGVLQRAAAFPVEESLKVEYRSVMGVEIPMVSLEETEPAPYYSLSASNSQLDVAYLSFLEVKRLTAQLAQVETSVYRLANAIKKTQKRSNALKNIIIPNFEQNVKFITGALEEKEREEFSRLKVIKKTKERKKAEENPIE